MKKIIILSIIALFAAISLRAQETGSEWDKANTAYAEGNFAEAITIYNNILATGLESSNLYYNLANAYYKSDSVAKAIINYNRALKLAPSDESILHNLEIAEARTINRIEKVPTFILFEWAAAFKNIFSSDLWAIISLVAFAVTLMFVAYYLLSGTALKRKVSFSISTTALVVFILSLTMSIRLKNDKINSHDAIVVSSAAPVKSSPDKNGKDLFILNEGAKVKIKDNMNGYSEVTIESGNKGWIPTSAIEII